MITKEKPIIIWTFRRTGGTSLARFLFGSSSYDTVQHEPFNGDRIWGCANKSAREVKYKSHVQDIQAVYQSVLSKVGELRNIKHTLDTSCSLLSSLLLKATTECGYNHLVLVRENQLERLVSLELAKQTDVWGKKGSLSVYDEIKAGRKTLDPLDWDLIRKQFQSDNAAIGKLFQEFHSQKICYKIVSFEELYSEDRTKEERIDRVLKLLQNYGIVNFSQEELDTVLFNSSQKSKSIYSAIPNLKHIKKMAEIQGLCASY